MTIRTPRVLSGRLQGLEAESVGEAIVGEEEAHVKGGEQLLLAYTRPRQGDWGRALPAQRLSGDRAIAPGFAPALSTPTPGADGA